MAPCQHFQVNHLTCIPHTIPLNGVFVLMNSFDDSISALVLVLVSIIRPYSALCGKMVDPTALKASPVNIGAVFFDWFAMSNLSSSNSRPPRRASSGSVSLFESILWVIDR